MSKSIKPIASQQNTNKNDTADNTIFNDYEEKNLCDQFDGDGENPVYLNDGVWLYPDGSMRDDKD